MNRFYLVSAIALLSCQLLGGCDSGKEDLESEVVQRGPGEAPVLQVKKSNQEMAEAVEKARETFPSFLENWKNQKNTAVSIKFAIPTDNGELEHIWFQPTEITDEKIDATCGNKPLNVSGLKYGDSRSFTRNDISDWMILVKEKCYGGYTIRVQAKLNPKNAPPFTFVDF